jgi:hypothetical protein
MAVPVDIIHLILDADEETLKTIQNAVSLRRKALQDEHRLILEATLYVGDRIRVNSNVTPKKIAGRTGIVRSITEKKGVPMYSVELDNPPDYRWRTFSSPASHFSKVTD